MNKHKPRKIFSPNVGTFLIFCAYAVCPVADAAYMVLDYRNAPPSQSVQAKWEQQSADFDIPFYSSRTTLGPQGLAAIKSVAQAAQGKPMITITGRPSSRGDEKTAAARSTMLKQMLIKLGVAASNIRIEISDVVQPAQGVNIFNSSIRVGTQNNSPAPTTPLQAIQDNDIDREDITKIYRMYSNKKLSGTEAMSKIAAVIAGEPNKATQKSESVVLSTPVTLPTPKAAKIWNIFAGRTLKSTIEEWIQVAGWNAVTWNLNDPYLVETNYPFQGSLIDAIFQLNALVPTLDFKISMRHKTILVTRKK